MPALRIKFIWSPKDKKGKFEHMGVLRGFKEISGPRTQYTLAIDGRAFVRGGIAAAVILWLGGVFGLSLWLDRNPYNRIGVVDLLLPWRWGGLRDLRGQMYIAQGRDDLHAGRIGDGVYLIRAGLRQHPDDQVARLDLGRLLVAAGQWDMAKEVLVPGLTMDSAPRAYVRFFFEQAERFDDREAILAAADPLLARKDLAPVDRRWLVERKLGSLLALRRFDEALAMTAAPDLVASWAAQDARVTALRGLGRVPDAIAYIESISWPETREAARLQLLAGCYREVGRIDEMGALLNRLVSLNPRDPEPRLYAISQWWAAGRAAEARRELAAYLQRFEANDAQLRLAATFCAGLPAPEFTEACLASARRRARPLNDLMWAHALAQLRAGDFDGFARSGESLAGESKQSLSAQEWIELLLAAVRSSNRESADHLVNWFRQQRRPLQIYRDALLALEKAGRWSAMEGVAAMGRAQFPSSIELRDRYALASRKNEEQAALAAKAGPAAATTPVPLRSASGGAAASQITRLAPKALPFASAADLWRELDARFAEGAWAKADDAIDRARLSDAPWLPEAARDLDWREIRVALERGDASRVRRLVGTRIDRERLEANRAIEIAREYQQRGNLADAKALAETILGRVPESGLAKRFLAELPPAAGTGTPAR